jgi:hypothetical protein
MNLIKEFFGKKSNKEFLLTKIEKAKLIHKRPQTIYQKFHTLIFILKLFFHKF